MWKSLLNKSLWLSPTTPAPELKKETKQENSNVAMPTSLPIVRLPSINAFVLATQTISSVIA
jgi:hypothetical protein